MAESKIPADIMEKAKQVRDLMWIHSNPKTAAEVVAEALLSERKAERERCAQIASQRINRQLYANGEGAGLAYWHPNETLKTVNGLRWNDGPDIASAIHSQQL